LALPAGESENDNQPHPGARDTAETASMKPSYDGAQFRERKLPRALQRAVKRAMFRPPGHFHGFDASMLACSRSGSLSLLWKSIER